MIIGITGKSGSGKSTVSEYLESNLKNSKSIFVDDVHIKLLLQKKKQLIELFGEDIIKDNRINSQLFAQNPSIHSEMYSISRDDLVDVLNSEIESLRKNYDYIIIDHYKLAEFQTIWNQCDYRILMEAINDDKRYENIALRYKKRGQNIERKPEEEYLIRDYLIPDYANYSYDANLINKYDESLVKQLKLLTEKIRNVNGGKNE